MGVDAWQKRSPVWAGIAAFLLFHALCVVLFRREAILLSSLLLTTAVMGACVASFLQARRCSSALRRFWDLLAAGLLLWAVATVMAACEELLFAIPANVGAGSQVLYFLYGAPLLLAICFPPENVWGRSFLWLDGLQISLLGFLTYVTIFNVVPFSHQQSLPVPAQIVVSTFNVENLLLLVLALLRFLAAPPQREQRHAFGALTLFLGVYAGVAALYNYLTLRSDGGLGLYDLLIDLPFLLLWVSITRAPGGMREMRTFPHAKAIALALDNAGPVLFPTAVLALSITVARHHYRAGIGSVGAALLVYAARSSLLQIQFQRGQAEATRARDYMEVLSLTDPLTGIPNRRRFNDLLSFERDRVSRRREPMSLLLIDIDYFKLLNDRFGHSDGDICLRQVAHALQASLRRESDALCRYGGEEFAALLPGTDRLGAEIVAVRMQAMIRSLRLRTETPLGEIVTVSIGIATTPEGIPMTPEKDGASDEALIRAADRALYRAKQRGRDRIEHEVMDRADGRFSGEAPGEAAGAARGEVPGNAAGDPSTGAGSLVLSP